MTPAAAWKRMALIQILSIPGTTVICRIRDKETLCLQKQGTWADDLEADEEGHDDGNVGVKFWPAARVDHSSNVFGCSEGALVERVESREHEHTIVLI